MSPGRGSMSPIFVAGWPAGNGWLHFEELSAFLTRLLRSVP